MVILKILSPVILLVISLIHIALQDKWHKWHDRRTTSHKYVMAALFILLFLSTIMTCFIIFQETRAESELREMIAPVLKLAKVKHQGLSDKEAIQNLAAEIDKIMNPTLVFLSDRIKQKKLDDTGQIRTDYYFRSKYPIVIRDARIDLRFDIQLIKVQGGTHSMLPFSDNARISMHPDRKGVTLTANQLGEAGQLRITVFTKVPPKLTENLMSP